MKALITDTGAVSGIPSFEYEIRDDVGNVLFADVVRVFPSRDCSTWAEIFAVVQGFLETVAAQGPPPVIGRRLTEHRDYSPAPPTSVTLEQEDIELVEVDLLDGEGKVILDRDGKPVKETRRVSHGMKLITTTLGPAPRLPKLEASR